MIKLNPKFYKDRKKTCIWGFILETIIILIGVFITHNVGNILIGTIGDEIFIALYIINEKNKRQTNV